MTAFFGLYSRLYENSWEVEFSLAEHRNETLIDPIEALQRTDKQRTSAVPPKQSTKAASARNVFISGKWEYDLFGSVTKFRRHIQNEIRLRVPADVFCWTTGIQTGDCFKRIIEQKIDNSHVLVVLTSPSWFASAWCAYEFNRFYSKNWRLAGYPVSSNSSGSAVCLRFCYRARSRGGLRRFRGATGPL